MLVSVHMPKTAGLSFRATLEEQFKDRFAHDYVDYPLAHPPEERHRMALQSGPTADFHELDHIDCIHGHFLPVKYLPMAGERPCQFVTWLREPLARLVSHYHYWQRSYDPSQDCTSVLHRRVLEEGWSLEEFCLAPELRNIYSEFLWSFDLQHFDFIGITEYYAEDFRYFCTAFLGRDFEPRRLNTGDEASPVEQLDTSAVAKITEYHARDMALYQQALQLRSKRMERQVQG